MAVVRRPSPRLAAILAVLAAAAGLAMAVAPSARADGVNGRQQVIEAALKAATANLDDASTATKAAAVQLSSVQGQLDTAQQTLSTDEQQLGGARQAAAAATVAATQAQKQLATATDRQAAAARAAADAQRRLDGYAVSAYETGATPSALVLVATGETTSDVLARAGLLDMAALGQSHQITTMRAAQTRLTDARELVRQRTAALIDRQLAARDAVDRVSAIVDSAAAETHRLGVLGQQRSAALKQAEVALAAGRTRVTELQSESDQIAALIRARAAAAAQARAAELRAAQLRAAQLQASQRRAAQRQAVPEQQAAPAPLAAPPAGAPTGSSPVGRSGLIWPYPGPVTSPFGYRVDPVTHVYQLHAGVDIGAPEGAPFHDAAAGVVIFAGQEQGYGNYTCVDHGGGLSTCYAHQSQILVTVGQTVAQGQVIGLVGQTGYATGPHLHFETRVDGNPVDPMQYF